MSISMVYSIRFTYNVELFWRTGDRLNLLWHKIKKVLCTRCLRMLTSSSEHFVLSYNGVSIPKYTSTIILWVAGSPAALLLVPGASAPSPRRAYTPWWRIRTVWMNYSDVAPSILQMRVHFYDWSLLPLPYPRSDEDDYNIYVNILSWAAWRFAVAHQYHDQQTKSLSYLHFRKEVIWPLCLAIWETLVDTRTQIKRVSYTCRALWKYLFIVKLSRFVQQWIQYQLRHWIYLRFYPFHQMLCISRRWALHRLWAGVCLPQKLILGTGYFSQFVLFGFWGDGRFLHWWLPQGVHHRTWYFTCHRRACFGGTKLMCDTTVYHVCLIEEVCGFDYHDIS